MIWHIAVIFFEVLPVKLFSVDPIGEDIFHLVSNEVENTHQ